MKKIIALIIAFIIFPMSNVLAADTPNNENSTTNPGETEYEETDSLTKKYDAFKRMDDKEWIDRMGNKDLTGVNNEDKFELTGLMNELFFNVKDMLPGDSVTKYMRLKNTSNVDYDLYFGAMRRKEDIPAPGEIDLFNVLNLKITKTGTKIEEPVYDGKLFQNNDEKEYINLGVIESEQDPIILTATVSMDIDAGNEYKNKATEVTWIFGANLLEEEENSGGKDEQNPGDEPGDKPGDNPDDKPGNNPDDKPGNNPSTNPDSNPASPFNDGTINDIDTYDLANYNSSYSSNYNSSYSSGKGSVSKTGDNNYIYLYILLACGSLLVGYVLFSKVKKDGKGQ